MAQLTPEQDMANAIEGLRKIAVVFSKADSIANTLEQFASLQAAHAGWQSKLTTTQNELAIATQKLAKIKAEQADEVARINAAAIKELAQITEQIADKERQHADTTTRTAAAEKSLQDILAKNKVAEQHRAKLLASFS